MMAGRANTFGSFLQTMNAGKPGPIVNFDREVASKQALRYLLDHKAPVPKAELGRALGRTADQCNEVIAYLTDAAMVEDAAGDQVRPSDFGGSVLWMFEVA